MRDSILQRLAAADAANERGDHDLNPNSAPHPGPLTPAAVLVPLVDHPEGLTVLLTKRTSHLSKHAGQISFPGGRLEPSDADAVAGALRETEEEIGLDRSHVSVLGRLDKYVTGTGFAITPIVGLVALGFRLDPDPNEVAEVFEVPLGFVLDPKNHQRHTGTFNGQPRSWYAIPYGDYYIWGATAGMLVNLYNKVHGE
jgi:8-oxo-dGTP pyrophosphatase MutT (NUDIX family)